MYREQSLLNKSLSRNPLSSARFGEVNDGSMIVGAEHAFSADLKFKEFIHRRANPLSYLMNESHEFEAITSRRGVPVALNKYLKDNESA